jgi:twitching motility protein PilJ
MNNRYPINDDKRSSLVYFGTGLLVISVIFVAITVYLLARNTQHEQKWMTHATEVQVTTQQMAKSAAESASGNLDAFLELGSSHKIIAIAMGRLANGSSDTRVPSTPESVEAFMSHLSQTWNRMSTNASSIQDREALILELATARNVVQNTIPDIQKSTDACVRALTKSGAPTNQVVFASRELVLADRILRRVSEVLQGGSNAVKAAENLAKDRNLFEQVLNALLRGNSSLGVTQVRNTQALQSLGTVKSLFETINPAIDAILASSSDLFEVRGAADEIFLDSKDIFDQAASLRNSIATLSESRIWPSQITVIIVLIIMVIIVWLLVHSFLTAERHRTMHAAYNYKKNQDAILRLLDEMSSLADGDLTVHASVTDDITGAIADSVNFAVEQLRELVKGIKYTAQEVAGSAVKTRSITSDLAAAVAGQAEQVGETTKSVQQMAASFDAMAQRSSESSVVAHKSVGLANTGGLRVRETINGMDNIRDQIQQTSKRIKRLGESSQEIGDIVEIISGIAEQTNVLALNAAIQAASAGGAGKGFAVVADEVQQLAESATDATRRIEILVQTIQTDTSEAVVSMEATTSEVVSGARLAEDAGTALDQIESVSKDLSTLIANISEESQAQSGSATEISVLMKEVQAISVQASENSTQAATSVETLAQLVMQLSNSVTDFKLPEDD